MEEESPELLGLTVFCWERSKKQAFVYIVSLGYVFLVLKTEQFKNIKDMFCGCNLIKILRFFLKGTSEYFPSYLEMEN